MPKDMRGFALKCLNIVKIPENVEGAREKSCEWDEKHPIEWMYGRVKVHIITQFA